MPAAPVVDDASRFYWEAARAHRLEILRCRDCGTWIHYPRPRCHRCLGADVAPAPVSGRGIVASFTVTHFAPSPELAAELPITLVLVELEEQPGLRVVTNLVEAEPGDLRIGLPVEVVFVDHDGFTLPQFRPRR